MNVQPKTPIKKSLRSVFVAVLCLAVVSNAGAALVVSYDADADTPVPLPNSVTGGSWSIYTTPTPTTGTETIASGSWNYITPNTGSGSGSYTYALTSGDLTDPSGWTATATIRAIATGASQDNLLAAYLRIFDGTNQFMVSFINNPTTEREGVVFYEDGMSLTGYTKEATLDNFFSTELSDDYVTVQIYYQPTLATASLYIDGSLIASLDASEFSPNSTSAQIRWGKDTSWGSNVRWNEVSFATGYAVVPEPSTAGMLGGVTITFAALMFKSRRGRMFPTCRKPASC